MIRKAHKKRWFEKAKERMANLGISYADLSARLSERGIEKAGKSTVGAWMVGRNEPPMATISAIAGVLEMSLSELAGEDVYFVRDPITRIIVERLDSMDEDERKAVLKLLGIPNPPQPPENRS